jgi:hypothetical protein
MGSSIFWLVVTAIFLSLATYCLFYPRRNRPGARLNQS